MVHERKPCLKSTAMVTPNETRLYSAMSMSVLWTGSLVPSSPPSLPASCPISRQCPWRTGPARLRTACHLDPPSPRRFSRRRSPACPTARCMGLSLPAVPGHTTTLIHAHNRTLHWRLAYHPLTPLRTMIQTPSNHSELRLEKRRSVSPRACEGEAAGVVGARDQAPCVLQRNVPHEDSSKIRRQGWETPPAPHLGQS